MSIETSRLSGFHRLSRAERLDKVCRLSGLVPALAEDLAAAAEPLGEVADHLVENAIGTLNLPLGIATNMIVDGEEVLVPMATEESSVIAAVCNGARRCRETGGVTTATSMVVRGRSGSRMLASI